MRPYVSRQVEAIIDLQLLTGARPGELVGLRPMDLDRSGDVWACRPADHKTAHHGHERVIHFGPRAQRILAGFLDRAPHKPLFSPAEAEQERAAKASAHRRADQQPTPRKTKRVIGETYTTASYRRAIERGCRKAEVPTWHPHQLRHNAASTLRREHGIDIAQTILGHQLGSQVTEIYAEANIGKAIEVIARMG